MKYRVCQGLTSPWLIKEFETYEEAPAYIAGHRGLGYYIKKGDRNYETLVCSDER